MTERRLDLHDIARLHIEAAVHVVAGTSEPDDHEYEADMYGVATPPASIAGNQVEESECISLAFDPRPGPRPLPELGADDRQDKGGDTPRHER